ncbi:Cytochrome P450 [Cordyceps militaris CM01]|uniref:Cytochrome P450 n=1 Tax=Cordyceps militaris (strain CM01) TaxID=983644 RepID=G3J8J0_CORMM|nr:Cytochrome P450 [Cordyceps militaris CM01]EGX94777.1 Cytochrome P450 [Cordyceps militaris CM01]
MSYTEVVLATGAIRTIDYFGLLTISASVYNLYFHKLASFPGPFLGRSGLIWRIYQSQRGTLHLAIQDLHRQYGPVVRISPNELYFSSVESWKAIYGHRTNTPTPIKSEFYDIYGAGFGSRCIGSERDPLKHGQMRKMLSAAFATKSLVDQEHIISGVVDEFVERMGSHGTSSEGLNMTMWYEMVSFDVLGKPHFWCEIIVNHLYFITLIDNLRRLPFVATLARLFFPSTLAMQNKNSQFSRQKVAERLEKKSTRKDFVSIIVKNFHEGNICREEMTAHVSTLTIAGGETTSTFLAATTYYLLKSPACLQRLQAEVVSHFASYEDISATAARQLPYLQAVISEGLRIYAPGSSGFPRTSPGMFVGKYWVPQGAEIATHAWTLTHSEENFAEPDTFRPERWIDAECKDVKEASQPFSLGPRGCLGQNFAYMEMNLILAKLLWKYDMELVDKKLDWAGQSQLHVMWRKPKLMVRFKPRGVAYESGKGYVS